MNIHSPIRRPKGRPPWKRWLVLVWFLVSFTLGAYGYWRYDLTNYGQASLSDALYRAAQLFFFYMPASYVEVNWTLEAARWMAGALFLCAVGAIGWKVFAREVAGLRLRALRGHVVVCGLGRTGLQVVRSLCTTSSSGRRRAVVVIDQAPDVERARAAEALGARLVLGDATRADVLAEARAGQAQRLIVLCPEEAVNAQVAMQARPLAGLANRTSKDPLVCHVQMSDVDLRVACQRMEAVAESDSGCQVQFLDLFDAAARRLFLRDMPLDRAHGVRAGDPRAVLLVTVGFGRMGRALALRAAKVGHFANGRKLHLAVLDPHAAEQEQRLLFQVPALRDICELSFHPLAAESLEARRRLETLCDPARFLASVALCLEDEARATGIALSLLPMLREKQVPLAVRFTHEERLVCLLRPPSATQSGQGPAAQVHPFGVVDPLSLREALGDELNAGLARAFHEWARETRLFARPAAEGERELWSWERLDEDRRESCRQQADHLPVKLRAIGCETTPVQDPRPPAAFSTEEVVVLARLEHARWTAERLLTGWRYAPKNEDRDAKTSPHLCPWNQLPSAVQEQLRARASALPTLLERCGQKAVRQSTP